MMKTILSVEEVRKAIYQDADYPTDELVSLAEASSAFITEKTDYNFANDEVIEPLAKQCAKMYVRQLYFGSTSTNYNRDFDYSIGITGLLVDLQNIVRSRKNDRL